MSLSTSREDPSSLSPEVKRQGGGWYLGLLLVGLGVCICLLPSPFQARPASPAGSQVHSHLPVQRPHQGGTDTQATNGTVTGAPSLSPTFIDQILALAHSPAQGTGQALYDLSRQYQVDDAYALAFFKMESQYGTTGIARLTRSLGNIRCAGSARCLDGYRAYATYQQGYQDWYQLIRNLYVNQWRLTTVAQIVPVYAPASDDNSPTAYIALVSRMVDQWQRGEASA